nr:MAG TPA: hypothetical protein [Caudoviricetes sp.]DAZ44344.1 MAG TPA: hypothetical protein [Caudoviricetes sp.]
MSTQNYFFLSSEIPSLIIGTIFNATHYVCWC